ncbi:MAG: hypothetical protein J6S21_07630, partial [Victivallales bacterium]|nr:hypothetical protein [Victivallales bacterium]
MSICLFALCLSGYSSESPLVKIPRIDAAKGNTLFSAEVFNESDWKDAAVIRTFSSCIGLGRISQPTAFYLFHDGATLIAAASCSESDFSDVRAFERRYDDDLTLDESVQLVMGLEDKFEGQLTVGGYEDAYAKIG